MKIAEIRVVITDISDDQKRRRIAKFLTMRANWLGTRGRKKCLGDITDGRRREDAKVLLKRNDLQNTGKRMEM